MRYFIAIILVLFLTGCSNSNRYKSMELESTKEVFDIVEEAPMISENEGYSFIVKQKLQELLDKKALFTSNPEFRTDADNAILRSIPEGIELKEVDFISPFEIISDSTKKVTTKIITEQKIDTITTIITTSKIEIDGEQLTTTKVAFDTIRK